MRSEAEANLKKAAPCAGFPECGPDSGSKPLNFMPQPGNGKTNEQKGRANR